MGWTKHEDAIKYYQKGLGSAHNTMLAAVESNRRTEKQGLRVLDALEQYFICCCVAPGGPNLELCDVALDIVGEIFPELELQIRR